MTTKEVRDWSFLKKAPSNSRITDPAPLARGLKDPVKDSEMQKNSDNYLKNNKVSGPDSFQTELIKTMPPEQLKVIQNWLNEILMTGNITIQVTEEDMTDVLSFLHRVWNRKKHVPFRHSKIIQL